MSIVGDRIMKNVQKRAKENNELKNKKFVVMNEDDRYAFCETHCINLFEYKECIFKENAEVCLLGNTINLFSPKSKYNFACLKGMCKLNTKFTIICDKYTSEYYNKLFEILKYNKYIIHIVDAIECYLYLCKKVRRHYEKIFNNMPHFDVVIMNPPYGNRNTGDEFIHHKITEKCLELAENVVCIMPAKLCMYDTSFDSNRKHFKKIYDNRLTEVKMISSDIFYGTKMMPVGVHIFAKNNNKNIHLIDKIHNIEKNITTLFDINQFNEYEKNISKYLEVTLDEANCHLCQVAKNNESLDKWIKNLQKYNKSVYLTSNSANGAMNGTWFSKTVGNIFDNVADLKQNFKDRNGAVCIVMLFDTIKNAEGCKNAMTRPILRFCLYKSQDDHNLRRKVYRYIPNINWSDPRVATDEGLLEVCGCPKDKCKEYAEYCKNYMEKVDNGTLNS